MIVAIHQPNYLPYPGFFAKLYASDVFVIYDTAQFTRSDFINRNRIRTYSPNGFIWLTLPVGKRDFKGVPIKSVNVSEEDIFIKHSTTLKAVYAKAPFFDDGLCEAVMSPHRNLSEHNIFLIRYILGKLALDKPRLILASEIGVQIRPSTEGVIDIVKALHGNEYISGTGARTYLQPELFRQESIELSFIDYKPLQYHQIHPGFVANMSLVDVIFNIGWDKTALKLQETAHAEKSHSAIC